MNGKEFDKKLFTIQKEELLSWLHLESDLPDFLESNVMTVFDRLEKLEKENSYLQAQNKGLKDIVEIDKQINIHTFELLKENIKLKKAIKILKRFHLNVNETNHNNTGYEIWTDSLLETQEITQEEYELLKEVLENA